MSDAGVRVTFDLQRAILQVEGPSEELIRVLEAAKGLAPSIREIRLTSAQISGGAAVEAARPELKNSRAPSMRDFARSHELDNTSQRIAILAYHAREYANKPHFSVKEMVGWFGLCGFKKPTQMPVALSDARRKYGYVESKGRDQWALAPAGDNLVLELLEGTS